MMGSFLLHFDVDVDVELEEGYVFVNYLLP